jgi:hypothetical protein
MSPIDSARAGASNTSHVAGGEKEIEVQATI